MKILHHLVLLFLATSAAVSGLGFRQAGSSKTAQTGTGNQQPGLPGTIRVQVRLVPVDVTVTDAKGRPVTDLKREDFQVFENGKPQEIRHFALQKLTEAAPEPAPPPQATPSVEFAPQSARTFLILMGRGRYQIPFRSVDDLIQFVRKSLLPQDRVAVFAFNRATDFTIDHERIVRALERFKKEHEWIEALEAQRLSGLGAIFGSWPTSKSLQPRIDRIFADPEGLGSRQLAATAQMDTGKMAKEADRVTEALLRKAAADEAANEGDPAALLRLSMMQFDTLAAQAITSLPFSDYASGFASTQGDVQNIYTCIDYLRFVDGEKHLVFFTDRGLMLPRVEYEEAIAAFANDARVALDIFYTNGCCPGMEITSAIRNMTRLTGGTASIYEYARQGLARLNETTRVQYLLGYYPKDENWDGKYRNIDVKVNRPGVRVSFRHGYHAGETSLLLDREEFLSYSRIRAAGSETSDLGDISFTAKAVLDDFGPPKIRLDLMIESGTIGWRPVGNRYTGKVRITVFYADGRGNYLGGIWKIVDFNLLEGTYRRFMESGMPITITVPRKVPKQMLKVIIYDTARDRVGSKLIKMR